jgi:hypothetical protein
MMIDCPGVDTRHASRAASRCAAEVIAHVTAARRDGRRRATRFVAPPAADANRLRQASDANMRQADRLSMQKDGDRA